MFSDLLDLCFDQPVSNAGYRVCKGLVTVMNMVCHVLSPQVEVVYLLQIVWLYPSKPAAEVPLSIILQ